MKYEKIFKKLENLDLENYGRDFLLTWEKTRPEIEAVLLLTDLFKDMHRQGLSFKVFESGLALSIFRDKSTRTRFSFASAANALGLAVSDLDEEKSQIAHGETVRETANMISFMSDILGIRDDMFLGEGNKYMREVAAAVQAGFDEGVLHQRPGIINLQCDIDHPTQSISDLAMLKNTFGSLENLRGKKIAMTWAYSPSYGKPLSVPQGLIGLMTRFGLEVTLAHPPGYDLLPEVINLAEKQAREAGGSFKVTNDMDSAFDQARIVYPKSWAPFKVMEKRTELIKSGRKDELKSLEKETLANNAGFSAWECNREMMKKTAEGKALYMHCLPADISGVNCEKGEVSAEIFEQYRLETYREASFKPFVIAAMMFLGRLDRPLEKLAPILHESKQRY
ncbi:MAG: knotted carbamoyltransferase YgeW [Candidatus Neomarinimicrobiota bacterium]